MQVSSSHLDSAQLNALAGLFALYRKSLDLVCCGGEVADVAGRRVSRHWARLLAYVAVRINKVLFIRGSV